MPAVNARAGSRTRFLVTTLVLGGVTATIAAARPATTIPPKTVAGGLTFNYVVTSAAADKKVKEASEIHAKVRMQGGSARMDYTGGSGPLGQKGAYLLMTATPSQLAIVSDKDKTIMIMDAAMFGSGMGAMMNNAMMKMTVSNAKFSFKELGAGESILGYSTKRVRVYSGMDVEMKMMGMTQKSSSSDSSDQWIAQVDVDEDALSAWGRSFTSGMKTSNPEMAAEFAKYEKDYSRKGMALRSITWSNRTDNKGKVSSDTIRMEVTDLVKGAIDAAVFKMPEGYQVTNLSEAMKGAQASMDSANKASGADTAKGKKPNATDGIKAGIGGMFKKKPPQ